VHPSPSATSPQLKVVPVNSFTAKPMNAHRMIDKYCSHASAAGSESTLM
jgi:hypothetical protein